MLAAAWLILALVAGGPAHAEEPSPSADRVSATFVAALDNHELTRAAQLIAQDAHVLAPNPIDGRAAIARWLAIQFPLETVVEVSKYSANGPRVTWLSRVSSGTHFQLNWEEMVVVDGQIAFWSIRGLVDTMIMPPLQRANALEPTPPMVVRSAPSNTVSDAGIVPVWLWLTGALGAATLGGLFGALRLGWQPRPERQSRQGGRLLVNLRNRPRA